MQSEEEGLVFRGRDKVAPVRSSLGDRGNRRFVMKTKSPEHWKGPTSRNQREMGHPDFSMLEKCATRHLLLALLNAQSYDVCLPYRVLYQSQTSNNLPLTPGIQIVFNYRWLLRWSRTGGGV